MADTHVNGIAGEPRLMRQTCPRDVHRDWWADEPDLACPWCATDDAKVLLEQRTAGVK